MASVLADNKDLLAPRNRGYKRAAAVALLDRIDKLCDEVGPDNRLPSLVEMMERFGASQHSVTCALERLERQGRLVRRRGAGTFVIGETDGSKSSVASSEMPRRSRTIIVIERPDRSVFDRCIEVLYEQVSAMKLDLACRFVGDGRETLVDPESFGRPLGILVFGGHLAPLARNLQSKGHRVALIGTPPSGVEYGVPNIFGNQEFGGYLIAKHLLDLGHRRFALPEIPSATSATMRARGQRRAFSEVEKRGEKVSCSVFDESNLASWAADLASLQAYFRRPDAPTAVMAWNDVRATNLVTLLMRAGVAVPDEVSVTGYDNISERDDLPPLLTTVETMLDTQVAAAVDFLTATTPVQESFQSVYAPSLVVRETTCRPKPD